MEKLKNLICTKLHQLPCGVEALEVKRAVGSTTGCAAPFFNQKSGDHTCRSRVALLPECSRWDRSLNCAEQDSHKVFF